MLSAISLCGVSFHHAKYHFILLSVIGNVALLSKIFLFLFQFLYSEYLHDAAFVVDLRITQYNNTVPGRGSAARLCSRTILSETLYF
jgi:hypothetical protein